MNQDEKRRLTSKKVYGPLLEKNLHSSLRRELIENFGFENLIPVADLLIEHFLKIIEEFTCQKELINPYQTIVVGVDRHEKFGYAKPVSSVNLKTAIVTLITPEEMKALAEGVSPKIIKKKRIVRILKEAYDQGVVLSYSVFAALTGLRETTVANMIREYEKSHPDEVIPHAGSIFDMGRTMTHKKRAVELMYQGLLTQEISRRINHVPKNVDKYLKDHKRVLEAHESGHCPEEICFLTGLSASLVKEHLELYENFKEQKQKLYPN